MKEYFEIEDVMEQKETRHRSVTRNDPCVPVRPF